MNNSKNFAYSKPGLLLAKGTIIPLAVAVVSILASNPCPAQITPDTTLGNQNSRVMTGVNIQGNEADLIEGGVQRGSNLYHSFLEFNVNNGQRVYFANPAGVDNIFSRITGSNHSEILGTLGVNGAANLFLLNPKGIIFGPNAQLDIQGSFLATTANSFVFPDGSEFSATNPQVPPLLTMSVPVGVQFGSQPAASITSEGELVTGKDLTLNAGNLDLEGTLQAGGNLTLQAQDSLKVEDSTSHAFIAAAGGNLLVQGDRKVDISALTHPESGFYSGGNMVFKSENPIGGYAHFWAGGNFRIENLNGDLGNLNFDNEPDDDSDETDDDSESTTSYPLIIRAIGDVSFNSYKGASLHILAGGSVNIAGDVEITGADSTNNSLQEAVTLSDGTTIDIDGSQTPTLDIRAGVEANYIGIPNLTPNLPIGFNPQNPTTTNTPTNANISIKGSIYNTSGFESNSGGILITNQYHPNELAGGITTGEILTYGDVSVDSRGDITTDRGIDTSINDSVEGDRKAGSIKLLSNQNILIQGNLLSNVNESLNGNGGDIYLNSQQGKIDINADIKSQSNNNGVAGNVRIQASGNISLFKKIESTSNSDQKENYNNITINSTGGSVHLNSATLDSTNKKEGYAGNIEINARNQISILNNSKISSEGNNGWIFIGVTEYQPKSLIIDNSKINTNSNGLGDAGYIEINASDQISLDSSKISSQGNNGHIDITTGSLSLTNGAQINSSLVGEGEKVGSVHIKAKNSVSLQGNPRLGDTNDNQTGIFTQISQEGKLLSSNGKGNITIETEKLIISDDARLSADTYGKGDAGDIQVEAQQIELKNQGRIISVVREKADGNSGNIKLNSRTLSITDDARISVSNLGTGNAGNITINASDSVLLERKGRISSSVRSTATGKGGNINIDTNFLTADGGIIEVQNQGQGDGGNIGMTTENLLLRRQSKISATAGSTNNPGNGGSITINAKDGFVVAVPLEDSDIIANAFGGKGGKIEINANRILGFQNREKLNSEQLSKLTNNGISDISASSDVGKNGEVSLNTLSIDPTQGLVQLPTNLVDTSRLIAQGCGSNSNVAKGKSEFVITGRGGLPPSPDDTLKSGTILPQWVVNNTFLNRSNSVNMTERNLKQLSSNTTDTLVEAVGMVRSANGDIVFTAQPTTATELQSGLSSQVCGVVQGDVKR
ncbi:filamentous hemagglutinin N-terminal domain-containing protein [Scytonema sp. UIC 10036]|uniref:two-partner secretion domain-containing protein n=1 Tax=Scytonema sp. UIC 10036 TaxID=2304196 RepID=UPI00140F69D8